MQVEITFPCELVSLNRFRTMHYRIWHPIMKRTREAARFAALEAKLPKMARADIHVFPGQKKGVLADPGNHYPSAKAAIDGLVDAGILKNDSPECVACVSLYGPVRSTRNDLRIVLVDASYSDEYSVSSSD